MRRAHRLGRRARRGAPFVSGCATYAPSRGRQAAAWTASPHARVCSQPRLPYRPCLTQRARVLLRRLQGHRPKGATSAAGAISGPNSGALAPREAAFPAERRADSEASAASSVRDGRTVAAPDPPHAGARESTHAWWVGAPLQPRLCDTHRLAWPMLFPVLGDLEPEGLPPVAIAGMEAVVELAATHRLQRRLGFVYVGALP